MFWVYFIAAIELFLCYIIWKSVLVRDSENEDWHRVPIPRWQVILSIILFCIPVLNWILIFNWAVTGFRTDQFNYQKDTFPKVTDWFNKPIFK